MIYYYFYCYPEFMTCKDIGSIYKHGKSKLSTPSTK